MKALRITDAANDTTTYLMGHRIGTCLTIGRSAECDIPMTGDYTLSQRHCSVTLTEKGLLLRDLGSTNGTYRNERAVREELMQQGIVYTAGHTKLEMRESVRPEAKAEKPEPEIKKKKLGKTPNSALKTKPSEAEKKAAADADSPPRPPTQVQQKRRTTKRKRPVKLPEWLFYLVRGLILLAVIGGSYTLYRHMANTMETPYPEQQLPVSPETDKPQ